MSNTTSPAVKLTATQARVIDLLRDGPLAARHIVKALDSKMVAVRSVTTSLEKKGLIVRSAETTEWSLVADEAPAASPGSTVLTEAQQAGLEKADAIAAAGGAMSYTKSGYARTVSAGQAYVTLDGEFVVARDTLDATEGNPWSLYRVIVGADETSVLSLVGSFPTSSKALAPEALA